MAARSIRARLINTTPHTLRLSAKEDPPAHGDWVEQPTPITPPGEVAIWALESDGVATGCEAWCEFLIDGVDAPIRIRCKNPFVGTNTYEEQAPDGFTLQRRGGAGQRTTVEFELGAVRAR